MTPQAKDEEILRLWEQRYNANGAVRSIPLHLASPPPPDRPAPAQRVHERHTGVRPVVVAAPGKKRVYKSRALATRFVMVDGVKRSKAAIAPCGADGVHVWVSHTKKQARCTGCNAVVYKNLIPNLTIVKRFRPANTELPPCVDPRDHWIVGDGKANGLRRVRCSRCECTRLANAEEIVWLELGRRKKREMAA